MPQKLHTPTAVVDRIKRMAAFVDGGTNANNEIQAADNLVALSRHKLMRPLSAAGLDVNGKLPDDILPSAVVLIPTLDGPSTVYTNGNWNFTITNYDARTNYNINVNVGSVSRNGAVITYTAPSSPGTCNMTINGRQVSFSIVTSVIPNTPSLSQNTQSNNGTTAIVRVTASAFSVPSGPATYQNTDYQLATDNAFTNIVANNANTTSLTLDFSTSVGTTYYARARHRDSLGNVSNWSNTITIFNAAVIPNTPTVSYSVPSSDHQAATFRLQTNAFSIPSGSNTFQSTDFQLATDTNFTNLVAGTVTVTVLTADITGLVNTQYYARARHRDNQGNVSAWSNHISVYQNYSAPSTPPDTPSITGVTVNPSGGPNFITFNVTLSPYNSPASIPMGGYEIQTANDSNFNILRGSPVESDAFYYLRARYYDNQNNYSGYGASVMVDGFGTPNAPGINALNIQQTGDTNTYQVTTTYSRNVGTSSFSETEWVLSSDGDGGPQVTTTVTNSLSNNFVIQASRTNYIITVRHKDSRGVWGPANLANLPFIN